MNIQYKKLKTLTFISVIAILVSCSESTPPKDSNAAEEAKSTAVKVPSSTQDIPQKSNAANRQQLSFKGSWKNVDVIETILPAEEAYIPVTIYDDLEVYNVTGKGFDYRNAGNDVGYGPNEQTYSEGTAIFTDNGYAEDKKSGLRIYYYQGKKKWDRGLSIKKDNDKYKKHFKKVRTVFEAGFNCDKAATHIEKRICGVAILAKADKELAQLYRQLRKKLSKADATKLRNSQRAWVKKRNSNCQDKKKADDLCLSALYASRLVELRKMSDPAMGQKTLSVDADFMKAVYSNSADLLSDTVLRLIFKSHKQDVFSQQWMTYKPKIKAIFSDDETVFTGQFEYETIIWPDNVIVKVSFQLVANNKGQLWLSRNTDNGRSVEKKTYFGPDKKSKSVVDWLAK